MAPITTKLLLLSLSLFGPAIAFPEGELNKRVTSFTPTLSPTVTKTCDITVCVDYVNECGFPYGGCYLLPGCTGGTVTPSFFKPPCPTTKPPTSSPTVSQTCTHTICVDGQNECGVPYGGCVLDPICTGDTRFPTFSVPPCPISSATSKPSTSSATSKPSTSTPKPVPTSSASRPTKTGSPVCRKKQKKLRKEKKF